ncbi:MAG: hypothetical protein V1820_00540 [archaeon]
MSREALELAHSRRKAQFGMPLLIVILAAILVIGAVIIIATTQLKVQFNISEKTLEGDQKPTLQALSYKTVGYLNHFPISFYDLVAVSAATGRTEYDLGRETLVADSLIREILGEFAKTELAKYSDHCFDYALAGPDGGTILTQMLSPGLYSEESQNCSALEATLGEQGMIASARNGNSYFIPVPPFIDNQARLTAQFIYDLSIAEGYSSSDAGRPFCKETGAPAASGTECCSGFVSDGRCGEK